MRPLRVARSCRPTEPRDGIGLRPALIVATLTISPGLRSASRSCSWHRPSSLRRARLQAVDRRARRRPPTRRCTGLAAASAAHPARRDGATADARPRRTEAELIVTSDPAGRDRRTTSGVGARAVGDGETTITRRPSTASRRPSRSRSSQTKEPFALELPQPRHPVLTRAGCNSGACHGALAGKGGLKLSLRGYDPDADHFVLTRQALGRRVDRSEPAQSLCCSSRRWRVPHGGGQKLEVGSPDYRVLADWIAAGAPGPQPDDVRHPAARSACRPRRVLKPKDTLQVLVRAWYSDGHAEDVTRWAKFNSSEDLVAAVDDDGKVDASPATARRRSPSGTPTSSPPAASPRRCPTRSIRRCSPTRRGTTSSTTWC